MFKEHLERRLAIARTHQHDLSVLYIDLDQFKVINDTMGHSAADALLCEVADRLRTALPHADLIARMGGDEFVVLIEPRNDPTFLGNALHSIQATLASGFFIANKRTANYREHRHQFVSSRRE